MKYACVVSYLGLRYSGFQRQKNLLTVQGKLEECLSIYLNSKIEIKGAGRTDAGVNAFGQVISFVTNNLKDIPHFIEKINMMLPDDICIESCYEVEEDFDPRHKSSGKVYEYHFSLNQKNPFELGRKTFISSYNFDCDLFKKALELYVGTHNFMNFTTKQNDIDNYVRTIESIEVNEVKEKDYVVTFSANGFMTYMVRILVGVAFKVGYKKLSLEEVKAALESTKRKIYSYKAKPDGLYLAKVIYPKEYFMK